MSTKITYQDKVAIQNDPEISDENKVTDEDMNNIKNAVNDNADELDETKKIAEENKGKIEEIENYNSTELTEKLKTIEQKNTEQDTSISQNATDISNLKQKDIEKDEEIEGLKAKDNELNTTIIDLKDKAGNKLSLEIDPVNYIMTLKLLNQDDVELDTKTIDFPLESVVVNGRYEDGNVVLTLQNETEITIPIGEIINGLVSQETFDNAVKELQGKIDECVKTTDFQESQSAQDQRIEALENDVKKKIEEYITLIEKSCNTVSGNGEDVTLSNTVDSRFKKFEVGGNSWQETREGYNLFPPTLQNGDTQIIQSHCKISLDNDEFIFSATGSDAYFGGVLSAGQAYQNNFGVKIDVKEKTKVSFLLTNTEFTKNYISAFNDENISVGLNPYSSNKGTYTVPKGASYIILRIGVPNSVAGTTYKTKVMIYEGTEEKPYEQHGTAPSSEFPSPIKNCVDNINTKVTDGGEQQSKTFPLEEGQSLCRKNDTEYDYLSDEGIVKVLEQTDDTGTKTIEESFTVKEKPEIIPYTEEQQKAYNEIMELISYEDTTHVFSEDEISPIFDVTAYAKGTNTVQEQTVQLEPTSEPPSYEEPSFEEGEVE